MNKFLITLSLLVSVQIFAQIPVGYYNTATQTGYALKTQLYNIIKDHNNQGYSALWSLYANDYRDVFTAYENDGSLFDIYSENPYGPDPYNFTSVSQQDTGSNCPEGGCYNREHLVAQCFFDNYLSEPMKSDAHHVVPSDKTVNAARDNFPFGKVASATYTSQNGSKRGANLNSGYSAGYTGVVFEPLDDFKGDVARSFFYFATRYENLISNFYDTANALTCNVKNMFDGSNNKVFTTTFLNVLLTWHQNDPVSQKEIYINNKIYNYQNNRNPFIDHPTWVNTIWGTVADVKDYVEVKFEVYPNPATNMLFLNLNRDVSIKGYDIFSIYGEKISSDINIVNNAIPLNNLTSGVYLLQIHTSETTFNQKFIVQ